MDKEKLTNYIKSLLDMIDEIESDDIDKETIRTMFLSIIRCMPTNTKNALR